MYKIDAGSVDDFILYTSTSNVRADELAIIKLKDSSQAENVKEKIEQRIDAQKLKFKDYRPNEFFLVENHVLKTKGAFVFFAVSKEADQMEHAFDDSFLERSIFGMPTTNMISSAPNINLVCTRY